MSLIKEIIRWFIYGPNTEKAPATNSEQTGLSKMVNKKHTDTTIDFDLNKRPNLTRFLEDLKSIEPISKQFSHAREEMLEELKKLGNPKGSSTRHNF